MPHHQEIIRIPKKRAQARPDDIVLLEEADLHGLHSGRPAAAATSKYTSTTRSSRSHYSEIRVPCGSVAYVLQRTPYSGASECTTSNDTIPTHYGALRPGGPVDLFSTRHIGLLLNWTIIGFFSGSVASLPLPFFGAYLGYTPMQLGSISTLINFPSYFKFIFGFITDNYAIRRQRRKPYMLIGWALFIGLVGAIASHRTIPWYGTDGNVLNADAPHQGAPYVGALVVSSFARMLVMVACEGMMVEFTHREGEYERGRTLLACAVFRYIGEVTGGLFTALGLGSEEYGGSFSMAIPIQWFFATWAFVAFMGLIITYVFVKDKKVSRTSQGFTTNTRLVWRFLEQRVTSQVMVGLFVLAIGVNAMVVEYSLIFTMWFHTGTLAQGVEEILRCSGTIVAASVIYLYFVRSSWRAMVMTGVAISFVIQFPIEMLTVWNVVRSNALFLVKDAVAGIFESIAWTVRLLIAAEASEPGLEGTTYGFLTSVGEISAAMLLTSYNMISASWSSESTNLQSGASAVQWHLTAEFIIKYVMRFGFGFLAMTILPRQKRELREIKIRGAPNLLVPVVLFAIFVALLVVVILSAVLSVIESTSCLPFAGGHGCD